MNPIEQPIQANYKKASEQESGDGRDKSIEKITLEKVNNLYENYFLKIKGYHPKELKEGKFEKRCDLRGGKCNVCATGQFGQRLDASSDVYDSFGEILEREFFEGNESEEERYEKVKKIAQTLKELNFPQESVSLFLSNNYPTLISLMEEGEGEGEKIWKELYPKKDSKE